MAMNHDGEDVVVSASTVGVDPVIDPHGGVIGCGFCKYDITTAEIDNMKELKI